MGGGVITLLMPVLAAHRVGGLAAALLPGNLYANGILAGESMLVVAAGPGCQGTVVRPCITSKNPPTAAGTLDLSSDNPNLQSKVVAAGGWLRR